MLLITDSVSLAQMYVTTVLTLRLDIPHLVKCGGDMVLCIQDVQQYIADNYQ